MKGYDTKLWLVHARFTMTHGSLVASPRYVV